MLWFSTLIGEQDRGTKKSWSLEISIKAFFEEEEGLNKIYKFKTKVLEYILEFANKKVQYLCERVPLRRN